MSTRDALLASVIAAPGDDAPRLVMADWLEENGEPERAGFIRVQCELAKGIRGSRDEAGAVRESKRLASRENREKELLRLNIVSWVPLAVLRIGSGTTIYWEFHRGFVEAITCTWVDWIANARAIMAATPLREATPIGMPAMLARASDVCGEDHARFCTVAIGAPNVPPIMVSKTIRHIEHPTVAGTRILTELLAEQWPGIKFNLRDCEVIILRQQRPALISEELTIDVRMNADGEAVVTRR